MRLYRRKCRHCHEWFLPDPRNAYHQHYCGKDECRKASRAASQRKWRAKNPDYYRGAEHLERVRDWRACHPDYWRRRDLLPAPPKDVFPPQPAFAQAPANSAEPLISQEATALQDLIVSDHFVLVGLAAMQAGPAFKDLIAPTLSRCYQYGTDLCGSLPGLVPSEPDHDHISAGIHNLTGPNPCSA